MRPAVDSPVRGAAEGDFKVDHDVDVQPRGAKKDVGADQVSDAPAKNKPLTAADVGPSWRKAQSVATGAVTHVRVSAYAAQSAPVPQPAPLPVERGGRDPIYFMAHPDLFLRYERETRSFVMKGPRGWQATSVTLCPQVVDQHTVWAVPVDHEDALGKAAAAFEVQSEGGEQRLWTYEKLPLLFTRVTLRNGGKAPIEVTELAPLAVLLHPSPPTLRSQQMRLLAADGSATEAEKGKAAEGSLAVVDREGKMGLVAGWVAPRDRSGAIVEASYDGRITVAARATLGDAQRTIAPGAAVEGETFAIGFAEDARDALRRLNAISAPVKDAAP
jgi:hypothetical protein